jgi:hypothetical protein
MKGHGTKFGRKMEDAVAALLIQRNMEEAAKSVGISTTTLISWTKQPEFQVAYREAKRAAFSQAIARLQHGSVAAATALLKTILDPNTPASVRVRASECVLNHGLKALELEDIEARIVALEMSAGDQGVRK